MKKDIFIIFMALLWAKSWAQESQTAYNFLRLPVSAHVGALGGENITITDDDAALIFHNPALVNGVSDRTIGLNYMTYMEGVKVASASFVKGVGDRATWGAMAQYMDYGKMKETTTAGEVVGDFSAKDIMIGGTFAYALTNTISGGITAKFISSTIAGNNSLAVGVDLGLNYYDEDRDWSLSMVAKNLGGQIKAYEDDFESIPFDLQVGATKRLSNSPFRFSATLTRLTNWDEGLKNHLALGVDLLLGETIYVAGGYNFRRHSEMAISDGDSESSHGAGLSIGAGISLTRFKLNVSYGKYHVSASSLMFSVSYSL